LERSIKELEASIDPEYNTRELEIETLLDKADAAELETCKTCGARKGIEKKLEHSRRAGVLRDKQNSVMRVVTKIANLQVELEKLSEAENPYQEQITEEESKINPFIDQQDKAEAKLRSIYAEEDKTEREIDALTIKIDTLDQLEELTSELKEQLLTKAVENIETQTNAYLEKYFEAELRVRFALDGPDDLTVSIQKSGHSCVHRQLSKGQRQLLKLCFAVSVMQAAANRAGVHFGCLFFDEALDGMDSELKIKAFDLFNALANDHSSIVQSDRDWETKL